MEEKKFVCDTTLLIDFSSPRPKSRQKPLQLQSPLIGSKIYVSSSPLNSDLNAKPTSPFKDPFEEVFVNAYFNVNTTEQSSVKTEDIQESTTSNDVKSESKVHDINTSAKGDDVPIQVTSENIENDEVVSNTFIKSNVEPVNALHSSNKNADKSFRTDESNKTVNYENVLPKGIVQEVDCMSPIISVKSTETAKQTVKTEIAQTNVESEEHVNKTDKNTRNMIQTNSTSKPKVTEGDDSHSCISGDLSTEEGLKAVIAKRVNRCIQRVLNESLKCKTNKKADSGSKKALSKRSLSFVSQSSKNVKCDRLNKSCEQFNLENEELVTPETSMESSDIGILSPASGEVSKMDESVFLPSEQDLVFKEANKLARTFSKIAESFCKMEDSDDDDLMTCQPRWMYADSSEDEEEKLRRDPALNIRVSLTNSASKTKPQLDSNTLSAFKSRLRLSSSQSSQEETDVKRSLLAPKQTKVPVIPSIVPSVPLAKAKLDDQSTKLKRTNKGSKKVPMKATVPLQSMTKDVIPDGGKIRNPPSPPFKRQNSEPLLKTPSKDTSQSEMRPVASSTPNKSVIVGSPHPLSTSAIAVPPNKRHSLGTTNEHKSRVPEAETGARQRSNSASCSGIPTPTQDVHKRPHTASQFKCATKPKSTSSLRRLMPNNSSQMSSPLEKKTATPSRQMKTSFNPRALNEVKSQRKSPKFSRVKGITSAITGFVAGKGKKIAASDKENRVPY